MDYDSPAGEGDNADLTNIQNKENTMISSSALQTFLKTYSTFISENQNACIDLEKVTADLNNQIKVLPPPPK
jgi:hypothetical protein